MLVNTYLAYTVNTLERCNKWAVRYGLRSSAGLISKVTELFSRDHYTALQKRSSSLNSMENLFLRLSGVEVYVLRRTYQSISGVSRNSVYVR